MSDFQEHQDPTPLSITSSTDYTDIFLIWTSWDSMFLCICMDTDTCIHIWMHWQQNLGNQKPLYVIYGPLKENNQWSSNIPISTYPKPCMINRDIDGEFEELDQEQIQTIKFLEDPHSVSLAHNNIQIEKKKAQKPKTECISRGDQTISNGCEEKANWMKKWKVTRKSPGETKTVPNIYNTLSAHIQLHIKKTFCWNSTNQLGHQNILPSLQIALSILVLILPSSGTEVTPRDLARAFLHEPGHPLPADSPLSVLTTEVRGT